MKKFLMYFLSLTWGLPITLIGLLVALALLIAGYKPQVFSGFIYFEVGERWGGFSLGLMFVVDKSSGNSSKRHEIGHGIQNAMFGIFMPFIVSIPSCLRYWYREYLVKSGKKKETELPNYYSIWFEKQATELGNKWGGYYG